MKNLLLLSSMIILFVYGCKGDSKSEIPGNPDILINHNSMNLYFQGFEIGDYYHGQFLDTESVEHSFFLKTPEVYFLTEFSDQVTSFDVQFDSLKRYFQEGGGYFDIARISELRIDSLLSSSWFADNRERIKHEDEKYSGLIDSLMVEL